MLIVCPSCATSYDVDVASLQPDGRQVRCVRCRTVWRAAPTHADKLLAAAGDIAPELQPPPDPPTPSADEIAPPRGADRLHDPAAESTEAPILAAADAPDRLGAEDEAADASDTAVVEAPPIVPVDLDEGQPPVDVAEPGQAEAALPEDIETYAARRVRRGFTHRKPLHWPLSHLQNGILALLIVDAILIGWRDDIVRILPQTASFYRVLGLSVNPRGLDFEGITTTTEQHEGVPILVVEGNIVNDSRKIVDVPRLKFALRNAGHDEIYSWTAVPPRASLPPGETVPFRTRLASPPPDGHDVLVRFITRRDILTGGH